MIRLGLIGHPVSHSKSPLMHSAALAALGMEGRYDAFDVPPDDLESAIQRFRDAGFRGLNVTVPHKEAALEMCDQVDDATREVGAVNTLVFREDGRLVGTNTDVPGFILSCFDAVDFTGCDALVVGAGGAARAVVAGLRAGNVKVTVTNRSADRGAELAAHFGVDWAPLEHAPLSRLAPKLVINATSMGMSAEDGQNDWTEARAFFEQLPFEHWPATHAFDLVYAPLITVFMAVAEQHGCAVMNGLSMLANQGAISFKFWTKAPTAPVLAAMKKAVLL